MRQEERRHSVLVCRSGAVLVAVSCTTDYVTGKKTFSLVSESQEVAMGKEADPEIVAEYGLYDNAALSAIRRRNRAGSRRQVAASGPRLHVSCSRQSRRQRVRPAGRLRLRDPGHPRALQLGGSARRCCRSRDRPRGRASRRGTDVETTARGTGPRTRRRVLGDDPEVRRDRRVRAPADVPQVQPHPGIRVGPARRRVFDASSGTTRTRWPRSSERCRRWARRAGRVFPRFSPRTPTRATGKCGFTS